MTKLGNSIADKLFKDIFLKFYICCVDGTLGSIKESAIDTVLDKLNSFHPSLKFTVDKFDDGVVQT